MALTRPAPVTLASPKATYQQGQAVPLIQKLMNYFSPAAREAYFGRAVSDEELLAASYGNVGGIMSPTQEERYNAEIDPAAGRATTYNGVPVANYVNYPTTASSPSGSTSPTTSTYNAFASTGGASGAGGADMVSNTPEVTPQYVADPRVTKYGNFDFNNPDDQQRFFDAKLADLSTQRDQYISDLERQVGRQLTEAELNLDETLAAIDQDIFDTQGAAAEYVRNYAQTEQEFGEGKRLGDVRRQGFFAKASPNAFQSAQGTSQAFAQDKYLQGLADLARGAEEAVGSRFLENPDDYGLLGDNTIYGRQLQGFSQDRNRAGERFNLFKSDVDDYRTRGIREANEFVDTERVSEADKFAMPRQQAGLDPFTFARMQAREAAPSQVDLGQYKSFTDFRPVSPGATPGAGFAPRQSTNLFQNQSVQDTYLNRTPNLKQNDQEQLRKYLLGTGY